MGRALTLIYNRRTFSLLFQNRNLGQNNVQYKLWMLCSQTEKFLCPEIGPLFRVVRPFLTFENLLKVHSTQLKQQFLEPILFNHILANNKIKEVPL